MTLDLASRGIGIHVKGTLFLLTSSFRVSLASLTSFDPVIWFSSAIKVAWLSVQMWIYFSSTPSLIKSLAHISTAAISALKTMLRLVKLQDLSLQPNPVAWYPDGDVCVPDVPMPCVLVSFPFFSARFLRPKTLPELHCLPQSILRSPEDIIFQSYILDGCMSQSISLPLPAPNQSVYCLGCCYSSDLS